jgi:hypothetical protein
VFDEYLNEYGTFGVVFVCLSYLNYWNKRFINYYLITNKSKSCNYFEKFSPKCTNVDSFPLNVWWMLMLHYKTISSVWLEKRKAWTNQKIALFIFKIECLYSAAILFRFCQKYLKSNLFSIFILFRYWLILNYIYIIYIYIYIYILYKRALSSYR